MNYGLIKAAGLVGMFIITWSLSSGSLLAVAYSSLAKSGES